MLARKITRAKWESTAGLSTGEIAADAVTADLRTQGNALSFWTCAIPSEKELTETVLALASAAERLDRFEIAWLSEDDVRAESLSVKQTVGVTPVASLRVRHVDIEQLDLVRLGTVAGLIVAALAANQHKRMTKKEVRSVLVEAVRSQLVSLDDLKTDVRGEVEKALKVASE